MKSILIAVALISFATSFANATQFAVDKEKKVKTVILDNDGAISLSPGQIIGCGIMPPGVISGLVLSRGSSLKVLSKNPNSEDPKDFQIDIICPAE